MESDLHTIHGMLGLMPKGVWSDCKRKKNNKSNRSRSFLLGLRPWHIWKKGEGTKTVVDRTYFYMAGAMFRPEGCELWLSLVNFYKTYFPDFKYNSIIVNRECEYTIHKDARNRSNKTLSFSLGDYTGGRLILYDEDKKEVDRIDTNYQPYIFDGMNTWHSVEEFEGERYSIVAYLL